MKKFITAAVVFFSIFPLFAQSRSDISVFIEPVSGDGSSPEDLAYFNEMMAMEVPARGFSLGETKKLADYSLVGSVAPYEMPYEDPEEAADEDVEYEDPEGKYYAFHIALIDNETDYVMVEQDLTYQSLEEVNEYFPLLIFNMLANIPLSKLTYDDLWRNKWLYFAFAVHWTPRVYTGSGTGAGSSALMWNFGLGVTAEFHFLNFMSAEAGLEITRDAVASINGDSNQGLVMEVPFMLKFVVKPSLHYMLEPYGGIQLNAPAVEDIKPTLLSWFAGFQFGMKAGGGAFFIDLRFLQDVGKSEVGRTSTSNVRHYTRTMLKIGLGYKYGFVNRI
jgi:hypothetical protein